MSTETFKSWTHIMFLIAWYSFYGVTAALAFFGLIYVIVTKRWRNYILLILNAVILVDCLTFIIFEKNNGKPDKLETFGIALSINTSSDMISHWTVSYVYLTVILEMEALLDKETHMSSYDKLNEITASKGKLKIWSVLAVTLCVIDGVICYVGFMIDDVFLIVGTQFVLVCFNIAFLYIWGYALIKLNRRIKNADKLIPNKRLFMMHGTVLVLYIVWNIVFLVCFSWAYYATGDKQNILYGIVNISGVFAPFAECAGFWLVLFMMTPITKGQAKKRNEFESFLLDGFMDVKQLRTAIYENNPDMTVEEMQAVDEQMETFSSYLESTKFTQSIVAEMCFVNTNDLAFSGGVKWKLQRASMIESMKNSTLNEALFNKGAGYKSKNI